jgi:peptidoglycan hydrolase-like protein with peptidoglycan-binding domain
VTEPRTSEQKGKTRMSRVLEPGMQGPDVALLQRDLNVWYGYWGAPARKLLDRDGDFGRKTDLAFRRARCGWGWPAASSPGRCR